MIMDHEKKYKEALERARKIHNQTEFDYEKGLIEEIFPELRESEDERIRKEIINYFRCQSRDEPSRKDIHNKWIAWLEKQDSTTNFINWHDISEEPEKNRELLCEWVSSNNCIRHDITFYNPTNKAFWNCGRQVDYITRWCYVDELEQIEYKPLYIRFGDIPTNEQSKIYNGENEIGVENGISVYPAFINGDDIILGLTLPITKTTLYTQQHLLEYDTRPCYLVKGNCVGKGADGEPLIKDITIIKEIKGYRIKELEKQDEQNPITFNDAHIIDTALNDYCCKQYNALHKENGGVLSFARLQHLAMDIYGWCKKQGEQVPADKAERKFNVGDWGIDETDGTVFQITKVLSNTYVYKTLDGGVYCCTHYSLEDGARHWTIKDAKPGDILHSTGLHNDCVFIFNGLDNWKFDEPDGERAVATGHCCLFISSNKIEFGVQGPDCVEVNTVKPANKESIELLFREMKNAGYEWDMDRKELKKIEQKPALMSLTEAIEHCKEKSYGNNACALEHKQLEKWLTELKELKEHKTVWIDEDEKTINNIIDYMKPMPIFFESTNGESDEEYTQKFVENAINWLKSIKDRVKSSNLRTV